jgi:NADPH:quinone reductase-like Zn-dependent oxidoreductase
MTGILGGRWTLDGFAPMGDIPTAVKLTSYSGEASDIAAEQLQRYVDLVEAGTLSPAAGPVFAFEQLREAHALMDSNRAGGKIVCTVGARRRLRAAPT